MSRPVASWPRLVRLLRRRGRSSWDAEDLIQEALLRLEEYRQKAQIRDKEAFLTRTVCNLATSQFRHDSIVSYAKEPIEELGFLADPSPGPDRQLEGEQRLAEIVRILDEVDRRVREIYLAHLAGYPYPEIAKAFNISVPTVERDMARAVLALTQNWAPE